MKTNNNEVLEIAVRNEERAEKYKTLSIIYLY